MSPPVSPDLSPTGRRSRASDLGRVRRLAGDPLHRLPPALEDQQGEPPGPEASAGKARRHPGSPSTSPTLAVRVLGRRAAYAATADGVRTWQHLQAVLPGMAIAGGTDEVLRNIIGERVLGLLPERAPTKA